MKRDVNFIFFGLLLLLLIAMVGVMLYSDYTYHKVNSQYMEFKNMFEEAQQDLNQSRAEVRAKELALNEKEQQLIDIIKELNLSKQKESSLSTYYSTVKSEKEELNESLSEATTDRDKCRADLGTKDLELGVCNRNYQLEKNLRLTCDDKISVYKLAGSEAAKKAEELMTALEDLECKNKTTCQDDTDAAIDLLQALQAEITKIR